jgi:uracil-DNA glycosylase
MVATALAIQRHQTALRECARCPAMVGRPVTGAPVCSPVMLIGQAPGAREVEKHRPFAWTAGKTLFGWFAPIGLDEPAFRSRVYMAAVCRCFPGKNPRGGDRVPNREEIAHCRHWLQKELRLLQPQLLLPVGKLAIQQFMPLTRLDAVIGQQYHLHLETGGLDVIPLPHPSGASTWHRTEPGKSLLQQALHLIGAHAAWKTLLQGPS